MVQVKAVLVLRCVIHDVLSNNKNKLYGIYVYRHKHNCILCIMYEREESVANQHN